MAKETKSKALSTKKQDASFAMTFGESELNLIKETITPGATQTEFNLFVYDAQSRGLNPLRKEIYWVQRENSFKKPDGSWGKKKVSSHQVGIDGFRKVAQSTGEYEGQAEIRYGEDIELFGIHVPEYAEVGVRRKGFTEPLFARAYFVEHAQAYEDKYKKGVKKLGSMWAKMPRLMIAKCAEALALRKSFPDSLSGLYTTDEMSSADNDVEVKEVTPKTAATPKLKEVDPKTGEIKQEDFDLETPITDSKPQCATRTQEKQYAELMDKLGLLMSWTPTATQQMMVKGLESLKAKAFEDLSEVMAGKLIAKIEQKIKEKEVDAETKVKEEVSPEDVAAVFDSTVEDVK